MTSWDQVGEAVWRVRDTCNAYVVRRGNEAVAVDFGSGALLDVLPALGIDRLTDVLLTHHHRDQAQGLARAVEAGARVWVPEAEQELVAGVDRHWRRRSVENDYDLRQDRFSLLRSVPVTGVAAEYRRRAYGPFELTTLPTPGHTPGSVSYLLEEGGGLLAFTGDLVYGDGAVWSLAATQWTYSGAEGLIATYLSCGTLAGRRPVRLLPSHGEPVDDVRGSLDRLRGRVRELAELRLGHALDLDEWEREPWVEVSPHLLRNRTSFATSYALLSESGGALVVDWGYDQAPGTDLPTDRAARRPLLASIEALRRDHGVEHVEALVLTHFHDDHVAGANLLRDVEGAEVWTGEAVAEVLEQPERYDLPCLWYDPVRVDRRIAAGGTVRWHEYELAFHPLPGHTLHAVAVSFEADGRRVLAVGDQQAHLPDDGAILNYQYRNRFRLDDFVASAELYRRLRPDLLLTGHWGVKEVTEPFLRTLERQGGRLAELHRELLPLDEVDFGAEGVAARILPYRSRVDAGASLELEIRVRNPFAHPADATVRLVVPEGWPEPPVSFVRLDAHGEGAVRVETTAAPAGLPARLAADVTIDGTPFGQQAEALVEVR